MGRTRRACSPRPPGDEAGVVAGVEHDRALIPKGIRELTELSHLLEDPKLVAVEAPPLVYHDLIDFAVCWEPEIDAGEIEGSSSVHDCEDVLPPLYHCDLVDDEPSEPAEEG